MPSLESANERGAGVLNGRLGMELVELGDDYLVGRMPVDPRTHQPAGVLHGGASVAFAETLASWAGSSRSTAAVSTVWAWRSMPTTSAPPARGG